MSKPVVGILLLLATLLPAFPARAQIATTVHNLTATGPGVMTAPGAAQLCVFCHTPHRASTTRALWNRELPTVTYKLYGSSTLEATLKQPTGSSRLCLSCHDGTAALGALRVAPVTGRVTMGPLKGRASLGTDLSDDHPISFIFDAALSAKQGQLHDPAALPKSLPLDNTRQLQCTTCHDAHDARNRKFLRMDDRGGALCSACHRQRNWLGSTHATSPATWRGTGANPWLSTPYTSVADNGCENCHRPHAAPGPPRLLSASQQRDVCLVCHAGTVASKNLDAEFLKFSAHPIVATDFAHDPKEDPNTMPRHVACTDCHNPHQVSPTPASRPEVPGRMKGVKGVNVTGATVSEARNEYEVCLKCHGIRDQTSALPLIRQDNIRNIRLKINPSNPSFHPVANVGRNAAMGGFEPGYSTASLLYCTDCHNNDEWTATGTQPRGPHGSRYQPILEREYLTTDPTVETFQNYALCYKCHNRSFLINDQARTFLHNLHVSGQQAPCAACHDAHGSRQNSRLINFMRLDRTAKSVVSASTGGRLEFNTPRPGGGPGSGQCFLTCHNKNHGPLCYDGGRPFHDPAGTRNPQCP